jgi:hypothetical protein
MVCHSKNYCNTMKKQCRRKVLSKKIGTRSISFVIPDFLENLPGCDFVCNSNWHKRQPLNSIDNLLKINMSNVIFLIVSNFFKYVRF